MRSFNKLFGDVRSEIEKYKHHWPKGRSTNLMNLRTACGLMYNMEPERYQAEVRPYVDQSLVVLNYMFVAYTKNVDDLIGTNKDTLFNKPYSCDLGYILSTMDLDRVFDHGPYPNVVELMFYDHYVPSSVQDDHLEKVNRDLLNNLSTLFPNASYLDVAATQKVPLVNDLDWVSSSGVKILSLSYCQFSHHSEVYDFPEGLSQMDLEELSLRDLSQRFDLNILAGLTQLKILDLSLSHVFNLSGLLELSSLELLDVAAIRFKSSECHLWKEVFSIPSLQWVRLNWSMISALMVEFGSRFFIDVCLPVDVDTLSISKDSDPIDFTFLLPVSRTHGAPLSFQEMSMCSADSSQDDLRVMLDIVSYVEGQSGDLLYHVKNAVNGCRDDHFDQLMKIGLISLVEQYRGDFDGGFLVQGVQVISDEDPVVVLGPMHPWIVGCLNSDFYSRGSQSISKTASVYSFDFDLPT